MPNEIVKGTLTVNSPASAKPFNVLSLNAQSFRTLENMTQSYFIVARDINAAAPNGTVRFSVKGDGSIDSPTIAALQLRDLQLQAEISALRAEMFQNFAIISGLLANKPVA